MKCKYCRSELIELGMIDSPQLKLCPTCDKTEEMPKITEAT